MVRLHRFDRQVAPLFDIPSLEKLSLSWLYPEPPTGPVAIPVAANLTALILRDNDMREDVLRTLLRATPLLEFLECDLFYNYEFREQCNCRNLNTALGQVANTLRTLVLSVRAIWNMFVFDGAWTVIDGTMGSMTHYQRLKSVFNTH